jgi:phenylacetate-CoA ligase
MAFIPDIELESPEQQADFQLKKLRELVAYVSLHSPFYQQRNLDADTLTSLKDLEQITTLGVEGMPLLRYRTGDVCCYDEAPCACGRTTRRLSPLMGRKKQMIKYKGTTLYPSAIFELLNQCSFIKEYILEVKSNEMGMDDLVLHVSTPLVVDDCERKIKPFLQSQLRVVPLINYLSSVEIHTMQFPEGSRKAIKFIDHRKTELAYE